LIKPVETDEGRDDLLRVGSDGRESEEVVGTDEKATLQFWSVFASLRLEVASSLVEEHSEELGSETGTLEKKPVRESEEFRVLRTRTSFDQLALNELGKKVEDCLHASRLL
jgi:hypothetical protein